MPAIARRSAATPAFLRVLVALLLPFVGAITVAGTYLGKEVIIAAAWVAVGTVGFLFVRPAIGIATMTAVYMLAAYPTLLQALGFLTINNLLGMAFVVLLAMRILETRDLSFLRMPPVLVFLGIGACFIVSSYYSEWAFPLLQASRGRMYLLDRSTAMAHDFVTRLVFLVFISMFVRTRADIKLVFIVFVLALFMAVPSALVNWITGNLNKGFRVASSVTAGSNPNRLAMICLMEAACWWFWAHYKRTTFARGWALACIGGSMMVLLATGSRSGVLGLVVTGLALQSGARQYRVSPKHIGMLAVVGLVALFTVVPPEARQRMINFSPERGEAGASSNKLREETIWTGLKIAQDHPVFGIGLGNFREVSRQVYRDKFYRPPHNSFLWAATEGGIFALGGYLALFALTWRYLTQVRRLAYRDPEIAHVAAALRVIFILYAFFSFFADLWLNPVTYLMVGQVFVMRRYLLELGRAPASVAVRATAARPAFAVG